MIVAGLGCRKQCDVHDLLAALDLALAREGLARSALSALFAPEFKRTEPALQRAGELLGRPLLCLSLEQLRAEEPYLLSPSEKVRALVGVASVSESAALAGARACGGVAPRLLRARSVSGGATCALASVETTS